MVFQYAENFAKKIIEQNDEKLQTIGKSRKELLKESVKHFYREEAIKEIEKIIFDE